MKNHIFVAVFLILMASIIVTPAHGATLNPKSLDLTKNIKAPSLSSNPFNHNHLTNVHFPNSPQLGKQNTVTNQQDLNKAEGNYVVGQLWGSSSIVAKQANQAQQAQNSHQTQNTHQASQAQQAQEGSSPHKTNTLLPLPKNSNPFIKLP